MADCVGEWLGVSEAVPFAERLGVEAWRLAVANRTGRLGLEPGATAVRLKAPALLIEI